MRTHRILLLLLLSILPLAVTGCGGGNSTAAPTLYPVGRQSFDWTDSTRSEKYGPHPGGARKIVVYLWYPAAPGNRASAGPFLSASQAAVLAPLVGIPGATLQSLPTKSFINAPPVTTGTAFPVIVLSHGNGSSPLLYSSTAEYLASHGYIVAGISHTYNAGWTLFADNTVALADSAADPSAAPPPITETSTFADYEANWRNQDAIDADISRDVPFVLDQLTALNRAPGAFQGRLRLNQIGMFGHSFGGSHAFRALQEEGRVRAAADVDGTLFNTHFAEGVAKPFMVISSARPTAEEIAAVRSTLIATGKTEAQADTLLARSSSERIAFENSPVSYYVRFDRALHSNFTDSGLLAAYGFPQDDISTTEDARVLLNTSNDYLRAFFDETLKGLYAPLLHQAPPLRDVVFEKRPTG